MCGGRAVLVGVGLRNRDRRRDLPGQLANQLINLSYVPTGNRD